MVMNQPPWHRLEPDKNIILTFPAASYRNRPSATWAHWTACCRGASGHPVVNIIKHFLVVINTPAKFACFYRWSIVSLSWYLRVGQCKTPLRLYQPLTKEYSSLAFFFSLPERSILQCPNLRKNWLYSWNKLTAFWLFDPSLMFASNKMTF